MARARNLTVPAFVAMAIAIVGLVGIYASFAAPLPLQRALLREAALDAALAAAQTPDPAAALKALAPRLGDSAPTLITALNTGELASLPARIQAERIAMRARFATAAADLAFRLRLLIGLITLSAVGFMVVMMGARGNG